ncbi:MAG: hypothetical protein U1F36_10700 [Planctomycetota bacterium]
MAEPNDDPIVREMRQLDDAAWLQMPQPLPPQLQSATGRIADGLVRVGAPARLDVAARSVLPMLVVSGDCAARRALCPPELNTSVIGIDLDSGAAAVVNAFPLDPSKTGEAALERQGPREYPKEGVKPAGQSRFAAAAGAEIVGRTWFDAFALGVAERRPGRFALRALTFDRLSNATTVTCFDPRRPATSQGVAADVAAAIEAAARRAEANPAGGLSLRRGADAPAVGSTGCALVVQSEIAVGAPSLRSKGAARVAIGPGMLVDRDRFEDQDKRGRIDDRELPRAVVTVTVLIAELDRAPARAIALHLPCNGAFRVGDEVEVGFEVDLAELTGPLGAGPCYLWLLAGDRVSPAQRLDVMPK